MLSKVIISLFLCAAAYNTMHSMAAPKIKIGSAEYALVCAEIETANPVRDQPEVITLALKEQSIDTLFFDRKSDTLLILGQGFPGSKEGIACIAWLFPDYDVVSFDYRWRDLYTYAATTQTILHPVQRMIHDCVDDAEIVVRHFKEQKQYREVVGLGLCYSNYTFLAAQVRSNLFTKLIFDSSWTSLNEFIRHICLDPWLPCSPQEGGSPEWLKSILKTSFVHSCLTSIVDLCCPTISVVPILEQLRTTPILFIHGAGDLLVDYPNNFAALWQAVATDHKAAFITPSRHSDNMDPNPTLYHAICDTFIRTNSLSDLHTTLMQTNILLFQ